MYTCRECDREINQATELCPYCGADLTVPTAAESAADGSGHRHKPRLAAALARWGFLLGAMLLFVWFILLLPGPVPHSGRDAGRQAEARALEALGEVQAVLANYAAVRGGAFPPNLESLGEPVRRPAQQAQSEGYRLGYQPEADADGVVRRYALLARAGHYGYRNFYTDQTGIIRATRENRSATAHDPPLEPDSRGGMTPP